MAKVRASQKILWREFLAPVLLEPERLQLIEARRLAALERGEAA